MALLRPTLGVLLHFVVIAVATLPCSARRCQTLNQLPQAALHLVIFLQ